MKFPDKRPQVEIVIRGIRKLTKKDQKWIGDWMKSRGQVFKKEELSELSNKFQYRLYP